ncbi:benenodin family lasso peptide [Sphingobium sp. YR768]|jgi:hypothetical protein|nr:benenodin family lasso peptide [Sphingobium sp. YR768]SER23973.1 hypothetical protein SAMN05518866_10759 [Sphingobium sp. YR768]
MERDYERNDEELIDLGSASVETKGNVGGQGDTIGLMRNSGISDD